MISIHQALDSVLADIRPLGAEEVRLLDALGRSAAERIVSPEQVPTFANSAMDGFAVSGAELEAGRREFRVVVDIPAGRYVVGRGRAGRGGAHHDRRAGASRRGHRGPGRAHDGGRRTRDGRDGPGDRSERAPRRRGRHRRRRPLRDAAPSSAPPRSACSPRSASTGCAWCDARVSRYSPPGASSSRAGRPLQPGQIRNSNSFTAYGQVVAAGGDPILLGIARDDPDETRRLMAAALENDVVITSGGVSVGDYDFVKQVQDELGVRAALLGRRHQAGQAARVRRPRRDPGVRRAGQSGRRHGELRDVRAAGAPGSAGPPGRLPSVVLRRARTSRSTAPRVAPRPGAAGSHTTRTARCASRRPARRAPAS